MTGARPTDALPAQIKAERRAAQIEQEKAAMEASSDEDDAMGQAPKKRKIKVKKTISKASAGGAYACFPAF